MVAGLLQLHLEVGINAMFADFHTNFGGNDNYEFLVFNISSVQLLSHVRLFATHGLQHSRPPCPSPTPGVYSNSCSLSWWCHPTISSSVIPFFSYLQPFPASGSFLMSQLFASGCQSIGALASASVLPMNIQDWFPLGLTGLISLLSKGLSGVFSSTTVWRHQFFSAQLSHLYMTTGKPIDDSFTWSFLSESITK